MTRLLLPLTALFLLLAGELRAECANFDVERELANIPIVVRGVVEESTPLEKLGKCWVGNGSTDCKYSFTVRITERYKGEVPAQRLSFSYGYWVGCPGVDTYSVGEERIWMLKSATAGVGELYGNNCGRGSLHPDDSRRRDKLLKLLGR